MVYYSYLLAVKYLNLIFWLKVYVAFNDLHIPKIVSVILVQQNLGQKLEKTKKMWLRIYNLRNKLHAFFLALG